MRYISDTTPPTLPELAKQAGRDNYKLVITTLAERFITIQHKYISINVRDQIIQCIITKKFKKIEYPQSDAKIGAASRTGLLSAAIYYNAETNQYIPFPSAKRIEQEKSKIEVTPG